MTKPTATPVQASGRSVPIDQNLAVALVLWIMLAGICVVLANAWAAGLLTD